MSAPTQHQVDAAAERAIRDVIDAYADRMRAGDVAGIIDLYSDDAVVMGPDMPTTVGRSQLHDLSSGALDEVAMGFAFTFGQVLVRGETAVALTHTDGKHSVGSTGDEVPGRYRELFVLNRQGADWKIAQYMFQPRPEA